MDFNNFRHQFFTAFLQWLLQEVRVVVQPKQEAGTSSDQSAPTTTSTPTV